MGGERNQLWPEDPKGGDLVPLTRGADGQLHFSWPNALRGAVNSVHELVSAPGEAMKGNYSPSELRGVATRSALTLMGLGLGMPAEENALKMFGGVRAKTADMPRLTHALGLEGRGMGPKEIHAATGWFRGPDNKWRFEIPDSEAMIHGQNVVGDRVYLPNEMATSMDETLHHPELYSAYPEIRNTNVLGMSGAPGQGAFHPDFNTIKLTPDNRKNTLSTLLHETQHKVQDIEGFAEGGSADQFLAPSYYNTMTLNENRYEAAATRAKALGVDPERVMTGINMYSNKLPLGDTYPHLKTLMAKDPELMDEFKAVHNVKVQLNAQHKIARQNYNDLAGEVEARMVQERHQLGDHESFPPETQGALPFERQIVVLDGEQKPRMAVPVDHDPFVAPSLVPAIKGADGKIVYGTPGMPHYMIDNFPESIASDGIGFALPNGPFLNREEAASYMNKHFGTTEKNYGAFHGGLEATELSLSPVEHDPWSVSAAPVDHDPFAEATETPGAAKP